MTKIIGYVASTLNGIIATETGSEDFIQEASWKRFVALAKKCGCMIQGRNTWEIIQQFKDQFRGVEVVTISRTLSKFLSETNHYDFPNHSSLASDYPDIQPSPDAAVGYLEKKGYKTILVGGGSQTFGAFLEKDLLDEMWVDMEPVILGKGPGMFPQMIESWGGSLRRTLRLYSIKRVADEVVLKYRVVKAEEYEAFGGKVGLGNTLDFHGTHDLRSVPPFQEEETERGYAD